MMIHTLNVYYNPKEILMKLSELATTVTGVAAQLTKVQNEVCLLYTSPSPRDS